MMASLARHTKINIFGSAGDGDKAGAEEKP